MNQHTEIASIPVVIVGSTEDVRDFLFGPLQHNEHLKAWRWHLYIRDNDKRYDAVKVELLLMRAEREARLAALRNEVSNLEAAL